MCSSPFDYTHFNVNIQIDTCMQRRRPPRPVTVRVTIIESTYSDAATELTEGVVVVHSDSEKAELEDARPTRHVYASARCSRYSRRLCRRRRLDNKNPEA